MGRGAGNNDHYSASCCSSSSSSKTSASPSDHHPYNSQVMRKGLSTDLRLGHGISSGRPSPASSAAADQEEMDDKYGGNRNAGATYFVKVYMEGIPIGRKLDLLAYGCYEDMIRTLDDMFGTNILWDEKNYNQQVQSHVLTYEDKEGDWLIVGDVPWEMFVSCVKRLKITRADNL